MKIQKRLCLLVGLILYASACDNEKEPCTHSGELYYWEMEFVEDSVSSQVALDFCEWNRSEQYYDANQSDSSDFVDIQIGAGHFMDDLNENVTLYFYGIWDRDYLESLENSDLAENFFQNRDFIVQDFSLFTGGDRTTCGPEDLISAPLNLECPWLVNVGMRQSFRSHELIVSQSQLQITDIEEIDSLNYIIEGTIEMTAENYFRPNQSMIVRNGRFRLPILLPTINQLLDRLED